MNRQTTINITQYKTAHFLLLIVALFAIVSCNQVDTVFKSGITIIDFKTLSFDKPAITLGDSSDVVIPNLPSNLISVRYNTIDSSYSWHLRTPAYIKVNHINPNKINSDSIAYIIVAGNEFPIAEFNTALKKINRHFDIPLIKPDDQNYLQLEKLLFLIHGQSLPSGIKTIYAKEDHSFILLDTIVRLRSVTGETISFRLSDTIQGNSFIVEFYNPVRYSLFPSDKTKDFLQNADTSYHVKVISQYTNWGASLFTIEHVKETKSLVVSFDKPFRYSFSNEVIQSKLKSNNNIPINLMQDFESSFLTNDLIMPNFSFDKQGPLGQISSMEKIQGIKVITKSNKPTFIFYLLPLLFVYIFLLAIFLWHKKNSLTNFLYQNLYIPNNNGNEKTSWKNHFAWLLTILLIFLIYRIFIAFQLFYTSPYFSYTFPTAVLIAPLILIAVYSGWSINIFKYGLNISTTKEKEIKNMRGINAVIISLLLIISIGWSYFLPEVKYFLKDNAGFNFIWTRPFEILKSEAGPLIAVIGLILGLIFYEIIIWIKSTKVVVIGMEKFFKNGLFPVRFSKINAISTNIKNAWNKWIRSIIFYTALLSAAIAMDNAYSSLLLVVLLISIYFVFSSNSKRPFWNKSIVKRVFCYLILGLGVAFALGIKHDSGFLINVYLIIPVIEGLFLLKSNGLFWSTEGKQRNRKLSIFFLTFFFICVTLFYTGRMIIDSQKVTVENFSERTYTRLTTFYDFDKVEQAGFKNSEGFAQFFAILSKYSKPIGLDNQSNFFHPAISSFSDPIVLNDLSFPAAGIAPWEKFYPVVLFLLFFLWFLLLRTVVLRTLYPYKLNDNPKKSQNNYNYVTSFGIIRIVCVIYLLSSGFWLIASYYGLVPFTGRLIFGFGQDSVGEVLETIILFVGMGLIYNYKKSSQFLKSKTNERR